MLDGMKNLQYATSFGALMAIMLLDYIVAFMVLGLCGIFRNKIRSQSGAVTAGIVLACVLRYICHVISGCTVWAGVSIPDAAALWDSIVDNATYMVPETLVCVVGAQCQMCIRDRVYGNSYECMSRNNDTLMRLFHSQCERHGIWHNVEQIFSYLHEFPRCV